MWIFDSYYKGCVELWGRERGLRHDSFAYPPSFYMHLKDPADHREMIETMESRGDTLADNQFIQLQLSTSGGKRPERTPQLLPRDRGEVLKSLTCG